MNFFFSLPPSSYNKSLHSLLELKNIAFQNEVEMSNQSPDYNQNRTVSPTYGRSSYTEKSITNHVGNSVTRRSLPLTSTPNEEMVSLIRKWILQPLSRDWYLKLAVLSLYRSESFFYGLEGDQVKLFSARKFEIYANLKI